MPPQILVTEEPYQIQGNGIANVQVIDPAKFVLDQRNPMERLRELCSSALSTAVGSRSLEDALRMKGRPDAITFDADSFERAGVKVYNIMLKEADVPSHIEDAISGKSVKILNAEGERESAEILRDAVMTHYGLKDDTEIRRVMLALKYLETVRGSSDNGGSTFVLPPLEGILQMFDRGIIPAIGQKD